MLLEHEYRIYPFLIDPKYIYTSLRLEAELMEESGNKWTKSASMLQGTYQILVIRPNIQWKLAMIEKFQFASLPLDALVWHWNWNDDSEEWQPMAEDNGMADGVM